MSIADYNSFDSCESSVASIGNDVQISDLPQRDADRQGMVEYLRSIEYLGVNCFMSDSVPKIDDDGSRRALSSLDELRWEMVRLVESLAAEVNKVEQRLEVIKVAMSKIHDFLIYESREEHVFDHYSPQSKNLK